MKKHAFKNNCHAELGSASQRFFGYKFLSFRGRSQWNLKNLHPLNDEINHDCHCEEFNDEAIQRIFGRTERSESGKRGRSECLQSNTNDKPEYKENPRHYENPTSGLPRSRWSLAMTTGKTAFTLAEVLITLTIIGIIAALTIPNLMQSYRKHQIESSLKSAYSILSNAITMAQAQNGSLEEMIDSCKSNNAVNQANCFTNNYLKPYLKYAKSCNGKDTSCNNIFSADTIKLLDGTTSFDAQYNPTEYSTLKLNNGTSLGVQWWNGAAPYFMVDVNGSNGPNQMGTDVFHFTLNASDGIDNFLSNGLRCGRIYYDLTKYPQYRYTHNCTGNGGNCSCSIMDNGWKIPDDYPVKKW